MRQNFADEMRQGLGHAISRIAITLKNCANLEEDFGQAVGDGIKCLLAAGNPLCIPKQKFWNRNPADRQVLVDLEPSRTRRARSPCLLGIGRYGDDDADQFVTRLDSRFATIWSWLSSKRFVTTARCYFPDDHLRFAPGGPIPAARRPRELQATLETSSASSRALVMGVAADRLRRMPGDLQLIGQIVEEDLLALRQEQVREHGGDRESFFAVDHDH